MLVQEVTTDLSPAEVIQLARDFFTTRFSAYAAFVEEEGDGHITFQVEAGELMIGTGSREGRTIVRGSTSRLHHELSQFLTTLAPAEEVRQNALGPGASGAG
ncbi:MAG: hypothetical protein GEU90_17710 [Gemmatimonas sp.]|nr:hypothetical protein [Gemmatimonas sp.]